MRRLALFLLSFIAIFCISAQELDYERGEILVQLESQSRIDAFVASLNQNAFSNIGLKVLKPVIPQMNIWLLAFDESKINIDRALSVINAQTDVLAVQKNHRVSYRSTSPNDPLYGNQWQYFNDGVNGAVADADIDADDAWDIATGGVTALGDTIVVCVIDDGIDLTHTDFGDNLWKNRLEIPNNNIDDDNNGYVDDFLGWNIHSDDDVIDQDGGHGTPVAGIVGAKGNNGTGVSGINWNVKLMVVVMQGANEANVLEAYAYPFEMRRRYNQSNGTEGAFVVSTNSSWGIDFGQPSSAPLWCNMYDSLGKYGILSCGATINGDEDIDVVGDLPTACPSNYLISVTNVNSADTKVPNAGYGLINVDLGAHGENAYTTANNNNYGGFGGTSGATPHVTGAVGLLYSAPCPGFMVYAKAYPDSAALLMKDFILNGVDPNPSLNGLTLTGGRLNLFNSLNNLLNYDCVPADCFPAFNLQAKDVTDTSASISWNALDTVSDFVVVAGIHDSSDQDTFLTSSFHIDLSDLTPCTKYSFTVIANCDTISADKKTRIFKTDGCCVSPSKLSLDTVFATSSQISWDPVLAAVSYNLRFREIGGVGWTTINTTNSVFTLFALDSCTNYEAQVATVCSDSVAEFTSILNFKTMGCLGCEAIFCNSDGDDSSDEWIEEIMVGGLSNLSGNNDGYAFFDTFSTDFYVDSTYQFLLTPGFGFFPFDEYWRLWIDYDQDGSFDDAGELAFDAGGTNTTDINGILVIPSDAAIGATRLRVSMRYNNAPGECMQFDFGEVEDYCINIATKDPNQLPTVNELEEFYVVPNPGNGLFRVFANFPNSKNINVQVFDNLGRIVNQVLLQGQKSVYTCDLTNFPSGVYYLKATYGSNSKHIKLVKQ